MNIDTQNTSEAPEWRNLTPEQRFAEAKKIADEIQKLNLPWTEASKRLHEEFKKHGIDLYYTNTPNTEWRDLLPGEIIQEGDEYQDTDGEWKPVSSSIGGEVWPEDSPRRTRRPLPTPENPTHQHKESCPKLYGQDCNCEPTPLDPIAQAIRQMEEAARVLGNIPAWRGVTLRMQFMPEMVFQSFASSSSLAKALGYKSPEQERNLKLEAAARYQEKAISYFALMKTCEAEAKKLREEAGV